MDKPTTAQRAAKQSTLGKAKLYCPIRLIQTHFSYLGALASIGINHHQALALIDNAKVARRRYIVANPDSQCFIIASDSMGVIQIWQAMIDSATPRRADAEAFVAALKNEQNDASTLAVFPLDATARGESATT